MTTIIKIDDYPVDRDVETVERPPLLLLPVLADCWNCSDRGNHIHRTPNGSFEGCCQSCPYC